MKTYIKTLNSYLKNISPDANIRIQYTTELYNGEAGELSERGCIELPKEHLKHYSVIGTKYEHGKLSIYVI